MPVYGQSSQSSYHQGFARNASESASPHLWKGLKASWVPSLGISGSTLIRDVSGNHKDGTLSNMEASDWQVGQYGYHLALGGTDEAIINTDETYFTLFPLTLSIRYRTTNTSGFKQLFSASNSGNNNQFRIGSNNTSIGFLAGGAVDYNITANGITPTDGEWHDAVGVNDGTSVFIYFDGVQEATGSGSTNAELWNNVGRRQTSSEPFTGDIGFVNIWERALTPNEVMQLHVQPDALFKLKPRVYKAPAVAPGTRRIMLISQYVNDLIENYQYN